VADQAHAFDDAEAYERFMGRWSRATGAIFLDWLDPPPGARWLDVGCGTGVFTELILNTCSPSAVTAIDPSHAQIEHARGLAVAQRADFHVAGAQSLAFADHTFDVVASALVINFIPDKPAALREMRRVARPDGIVAGYIWDFAGDRATSAPLRLAMRQIGLEPPPTAGTENSSLVDLRTLFERAGLKAISTRTIDVSMSFSGFDEYWHSQTPSFVPITKMIQALPDAERARLQDALRKQLPAGADGRITCSACANAIKARVPA
jgi:ubiquinone/menaquinone biosynthesis C-methylase UbiE